MFCEIWMKKNPESELGDSSAPTHENFRAYPLSAKMAAIVNATMSVTVKMTKALCAKVEELKRFWPESKINWQIRDSVV